MTFDQIQINLLLVMIIFLETAIILGQWLNHLAEDNEVRTIKVSNMVTRFVIFLCALGGFILFSFLLLAVVYPDEKSNSVIGIISGIISGGVILILDKKFPIQ